MSRAEDQQASGLAVELECGQADPKTLAEENEKNKQTGYHTSKWSELKL